MPRGKKKAELVRELRAELDDDTDDLPQPGKVVFEVTDYGLPRPAPQIRRRSVENPPPPGPQEFSMDLLFRASPPTSPHAIPSAGHERRASGLGRTADSGHGTLPRAMRGGTAERGRNNWDSEDEIESLTPGETGSRRASVHSAHSASSYARSLPRTVPTPPSLKIPMSAGGSAASGFGGGEQSRNESRRGSRGGGPSPSPASGIPGTPRDFNNGGVAAGACAAPPALCFALDRLLPRLSPSYVPLQWPQPPPTGEVLTISAILSGAAVAEARANGGAQLREWGSRLETHRRSLDAYYANQIAALHRIACGIPCVIPPTPEVATPRRTGVDSDEESVRAEVVRDACSAALPVADADLEGTSAQSRAKLCGRSSLVDYDIVRQIGSGGFGKVYEVRRLRDGSRWAMKVLCKRSLAAKKMALQDVTAEHTVLTQYADVAHPFIVSLACAFQTPSKLFLVMELLSGGQLFCLLQREAFLPERHCAFYAAEIALALEHLHSHGVVHRDLKPENVLLRADGHVCLTDFGLAKMGVTQRAEGASSFCGTVEYMAPEMVAELRVDRQYGQAVDMWALGVLLYQLATGEVPFLAPNQKELVRKIRAAKLKFPTHMGGAAKSVLKALLVPEPSQRLQLPALKAHPFFTNISWAKVLAKEIPPPYLPAHDALERSAPTTPNNGGGGGTGTTIAASRCLRRRRAVPSRPLPPPLSRCPLNSRRRCRPFASPTKAQPRPGSLSPGRPRAEPTPSSTPGPACHPRTWPRAPAGGARATRGGCPSRSSSRRSRSPRRAAASSRQATGLPLLGTRDGPTVGRSLPSGPAAARAGC